MPTNMTLSGSGYPLLNVRDPLRGPPYTFNKKVQGYLCLRGETSWIQVSAVGVPPLTKSPEGLVVPLGPLKVEHRTVATHKGVPRTLIRLGEPATNLLTEVLTPRVIWPRLLDDRVDRYLWVVLLSGEVSEVPELPEAGPIPA
jgi:hypothetical protein